MRAFGILAAVVAITLGTTPPARAVPGDLYLQVVAHEDDDLLFMNPDIDQTIRTGTDTVTVFVTAGQITGAGDTDEIRARNRQRGIQDAYARMAGVPDLDPNAQEEWTGDLLAVAGRQAERYVLTERPEVALLFLNLRDGRLGAVRDSGVTDTTVIPAGGLVTRSFSYDRAGVTAALADVLRLYRPSLVRAQDPLPDARYQPDHGDHVAAARFTDDAVRAWGGRPVQVNYRDYNNVDVPGNLSPGTLDRKSSVFDNYLRYDGNTGLRALLVGMNVRWPRGTGWAGRDADGRARLFVVRAGVAVTYTQNAAGGWDGAVALPAAGGPLAPSIVVGRNADGRSEIVARRLSDHHLLGLHQTTPNGGWAGAWTDLGNPNTSGADQVGQPVLAANTDGRLQLFVKNGGGGVSTRFQTTPNGPWGDWVDLFGTDVQDGLAAITGPQGRIELFAATRQKILHWFQASPNGSFARNDNLPSAVPAGPPTAALSQDGRIEVLYRGAGTEHVVASVQREVNGGWYSTPVVLGGHGGVGSVATVTGPGGRIVAVERNAGTGVSLTTQRGPNAGYGEWVDLGGVVADVPALTLDARGAVVVASIGTDGALYVRTQGEPTPDSPFGPWVRL
ncbi:hypothetical protein GCM10022243_57660 [Saccharothrix violaceirubra]|uniref:LmbE family N-acetylglucosaminyl deacetylase n=1 Tax=Saccharothrix violaceirubra TaxID=413306 RepID=A0A7W7T4C3_9PSEU|nr:PIG-L family deacetylase [Saccharothrix violaceirubra]MBB4965802.1 LmbE family N-acetylglucosaminyl deacetylase [Saccharothrix violaceirubra]